MKIPRKVTSLSDSYVDQSSSGSVFSSKSLMVLSLADQSSREVEGYTEPWVLPWIALTLSLKLEVTVLTSQSIW